MSFLFTLLILRVREARAIPRNTKPKINSPKDKLNNRIYSIFFFLKKRIIKSEISPNTLCYFASKAELYSNE